MTTDLTPAGSGLRALIVDDESLARLRLRSLLNDCKDPPCTVLGEAGDVAQALAFLDKVPVDLIFLDVAMPAVDGTQLAERLSHRDTSPMVIFVTAHPQHAVQAFELDAVDYLTKPVRLDRLQAALRKALQRRLARSGLVDEPMLVVTDRGRLQRIPVSQVLYFKAELKYVTLRTKDRTLLMDETLSELEERLGSRFIRIHRNALVARTAIRGLERRSGSVDDEGSSGEVWAVQVAGVGEWLVVSRRHLAVVREALESAGL